MVLKAPWLFTAPEDGFPPPPGLGGNWGNRSQGGGAGGTPAACGMREEDSIR